MKGSESLLGTAAAAGVQVCFANPGTTEISLIEAFDTQPGMRAVLGLAEGVVTGAADGYARMTGTPAMTVLHLGPGLANGIANLHNARRAGTPVLNVIGEHATWHQPADAPLASDIESLASPVSGWVARTGSTALAGGDLARAWYEALRLRSPATLIAAADHMWNDGGAVGAVPAAPLAAPADDEQIAKAAKALSARRRRPALLLGGAALSAEGLRAAGRIAAATGADLLAERGPARIERGPDLPVVPLLPYFPEQVQATLDGYTDLVLVGARAPVAFFGYPGTPSSPVPADVAVHALAEPGQNPVTALEAVVEATGAAAVVPELATTRPPAEPTGDLDARAVAAAIVLTQPERAIVVNEGISSGAAYPEVAPAAPAHSELHHTGGAIGMGMPVSVGAAVACPDRPVINFQADGSAAYSVQALWSQAREGLDVTTVICANSRYRILQAELGRAGVREPGPTAAAMTSLAEPVLDWTAVSRGFGVPAERATTGEELLAALRRAHAEPGPHLIEAVL